MITKTTLDEQKRLHTEGVRLTAGEYAQLQTMAQELGVNRSALIRDGLQRVYQEYKTYQQAARNEAKQA